MDELGKKLQEERLKRNIELQEISRATHISIGVLRDIENGNFTKYKGDEEYIKMYLRKYSEYLGLDSREYVQDYITITDAYKVAELESSTKVTNKSSGEEKTVRTQTKISNPKFAKSKKVYEDQNTSNYIRYFVIALLIVAIIGVVYFGISLMGNKSGEKEFKKEDTIQVSGDVSENTDDKSDGTKEDQNTDQKDDENNQENDQENPTGTKDSDTSVVRTGSYQYTATIPATQDTFTVTFDFVTPTWCSLNVNGSPYGGFEARVYNEANVSANIDATPEKVVLTFNTNEVSTMTLTNGYNIGHHYYINGVEVPLASEEEIGTVAYITFNFVKGEAVSDQTTGQ